MNDSPSPNPVLDPLVAIKKWKASRTGKSYTCTNGYYHNPVEDCLGCLMIAAEREIGRLRKPVEPSEDAEWVRQAKLTLDRLSSFLQRIDAPVAVPWRDWIDNAERMILAERTARETREVVAKVVDEFGFPIIQWTSRDYPIGTELCLAPTTPASQSGLHPIFEEALAPFRPKTTGDGQ
jgi:hypothetical protein